MSGRYRYEPSNGWLWILPPVGPSFASVYEKSASGADSNTRAVREIVIELNRLLDRAVYAESHRLTAETALDEAIARADKASNALIRTTAALRETTDRAEKAEARVAELEREVAAWSPARHYGEEDEVYDDPKPEPSVAELQQRIATAKVGYYAPCVWCWSTVFAPNGEQVTCHKCGRKTPVPAPEGTETGQKSPPPSPVGAPRSDQGAGIKSDTQSPGPGRSDPRAPESSNLDTLAFGKSVPVPPARPCEGCKGVTDSPEASLCPACRLWWLKQGFAEVEEPRPVVSCSDARCQCYQCVKDRADEEEDFAQLAKEQAKRATTRVEASPAAAAEVEARTGAYVTRSAGVVTVTAIDGMIVEVRHPRAGLPSRDEVAAFLEARWRVNVRDVRIYK